MPKIQPNPFDALGFQPKPEKVYTESDISSAYRSATLVLHPNNDSRQGCRFPQLHHATAARDFLLQSVKSGTFDAVLKEFSSYPRTFLKHKFVTPQLTDAFRQCDDCGMILQRDSLPDHLSEHGWRFCKDCNGRDRNYFRAEEFNDHILQEHKYVICSICSEQAYEPYVEQHERYFHCCPFCTARLHRCGLRQHAWSYHKVKPCRNCPEAGNLETHQALYEHLDEQHTVKACVFCNRTIELRSLPKHLETKHEFLMCRGCDVTQEAFVEHVSTAHEGIVDCGLCRDQLSGDVWLQHIERTHGFTECLRCKRVDYSREHILDEHKWAHCGVCRCKRQEPLPVHQVCDHDWKSCRDCNDVFENDEELSNHEKAHSFTICAHCDQLMLVENYKQHLRDAHDKKDCVFCTGEDAPEPMTTSDLRLHIEDCHHAKNPCQVCGGLQTMIGLPIHLKEDHRWVMCTPCMVSFPTAGELGTHVQNEHAECRECGQDFPKEKLSQHLINGHGWALRAPSPPKDPQEPQEPKATQQSLGQLNDAQVARLRTLTENDGGQCPYPECKNAQVTRLARHLRYNHGLSLRTLKKPAKEAMQCLGAHNRTHSVRHSYRCTNCKPHMTGKRKRDENSQVEDESLQ